MSIKTGFILFLITAFISEDQVKGGTITSPLPFRIFKMSNEIKFADDPEFTNTEYLKPNHFDQLSSNFFTFFDCVNITFFFLIIL